MKSTTLVLVAQYGAHFPRFGHPTSPKRLVFAFFLGYPSPSGSVSFRFQLMGPVPPFNERTLPSPNNLPYVFGPLTMRQRNRFLLCLRKSFKNYWLARMAQALRLKSVLKLLNANACAYSRVQSILLAQGSALFVGPLRRNSLLSQPAADSALI